MTKNASNDFWDSFIQDQKAKPRANAAYWAAALSLIPAGVSLLYHGYYGIVNQAWQNGLAALVSAAMLLTCWLAMRVARQNQANTAALLVLASIALTTLALSALISGIGIALSLATLIVLVLIGLQTLDHEWANRVVLAGILTAMLSGITDTLNLPYRANMPGTQTFLIVMAAGAVLLLAVFLLRFFRTLTFSGKLVLGFLSVALLSASLMAFFIQRAAQDTLLQDVGLRMEHLARSGAQTVAGQLSEQVNALQTLAIGEFIQGNVADVNEGYEGTIEQNRAYVQQLDKEWASDPTIGNPLVAERLNNTASGELRKFRGAFPDHIEMMITDQFGALVAASNPVSDYDQSDEFWWQNTFNNGRGQVFIASPALDESSGALSLIIGIPIINQEQNQTIGVLRSTFRLTAIQTSLASTVIGRTGDVDLFFPGQSENEPTQNIHDGRLEVSNSEHLALLDALSNHVYQQVIYEGSPSLISKADIADVASNPAVARTGWSLLIHQDTSEALVPVTEQARYFNLLLILIVGTVSMGAALLSQRLIQPILRLTDVAQQVGAGNFSMRAPIESDDEIGLLATTFNEMTTNLQSARLQLEEDVYARTNELQLAAEVGQSLAQVRKLDTLLSNAVELIQTRFNLYYTQIYLLEENTQALVLQAGSGLTGAELMRRGHRLPVGLNSINGRAAAEKRAVIVADTATAAFFRPNPLLPDTRSEVAVPLLVGERVVGVLDMQSRQAGSLDENRLPAFKTLAGQLAIAIENANLYATAQAMQSQAEKEAGESVRSGWKSFLDGLQRGERVGYVYSGGRTNPAHQPIGLIEQHGAVTPLQSSGAAIGKIVLERDPKDAWQPSDQELISAVAEQVVRRVENLRLLAQAEYYRAEAETANRRQISQDWQSYSAGLGITGFEYDQNQVRALSETRRKLAPNSLTLPLHVQSQQFGEIILEGAANLSLEDQELASNIANRLSTHLENLRLASETQAALATTAALYQGSERIVNASDIVELVRALAEATPLGQLDYVYLYIFDRPWGATHPDRMSNIAGWARAGSLREATGSEYNLSEYALLTENLNRSAPLIIEDTQSDPRVDAGSRAVLREQGSVSLYFFPILAGGEWIGVLDGESQRLMQFSQADIRQIEAMVDQASAAIQNLRLFEQTQKALQETEELYGIISGLNAANSYQEILTAVIQRSILSKADQPVFLCMFNRPITAAGALPAPAGPAAGGSPAEWIIPLAYQGSIEVPPRYPLSAFEAEPGTLFRTEPVVIANVSSDPRLDKITRMLFQNIFKAHSVIVVPLMFGQQAIGFLMGNYSSALNFSAAEVTRLGAVAGQVAIAVQSRRLLERTTTRAQREQVLREISSEIASAVDVETVLRRAVKEIGQALNKPAFIYLGKDAASQLATQATQALSDPASESKIMSAPPAGPASESETMPESSQEEPPPTTQQD